MKIVVLGANGHLGTWFVKQALNAGHETVAFVRQQGSLGELPGVKIVMGDVSDVAALADASRGADVVVSFLGAGMKDLSFLTNITPKIIQALTDAGSPRFVMTSVFGAGATALKAGGFAKMLYTSVMKKFMDDRVRAEELLASSTLNYAVVYPVNLSNKAAKDAARVVSINTSGKVPGMPSLSMDAAAKGILDVAVLGEPRQAIITTAKAWRA